MVKQKRTRTRVTAKEISASIEALDALLLSPPPPPQQTITLAKAVGDLAPKIITLLDAGYNLDQIAECIRLGGQPMLAAKLKRYLAGSDGRRRKARRRPVKGTTEIRQRTVDPDKSSSSTVKVSGISGEENAPTITTQRPPNASASPSSTVSMAPVKTAISGTSPAQEISQSSQPKLMHSVFETGLAPTTMRVHAGAIPITRPSALTERQVDEPKAQPASRLLDAAKARMERGAPPDFDPKTGPEPNRASSPKDERLF